MKKTNFILLVIGISLLFSILVTLQLNWSRQIVKSLYYGEAKYLTSAIKQLFHNDETEASENLELKINPDDLKILSKHRARAYLNNFISASEKEYVPVIINDTTYGKIRLKGNLNDHRIKNEWSYKVNLQKNHFVFGCEEFCLLKPERRGFVSEYFMHKIMKHLGFIGLHYNFINLILNDAPARVYAIEEGFTDVLLTKNGKSIAPIIKFDDDKYLEALKRDKVKGSPANVKIVCLNKKGKSEADILEAKTLLSDFCSHKKSASEVFNIEKLGLYFAVMDLLGNTHSIIWKNQRFYFEKATKRLEPIAYDGNEHDNIQSTLYGHWQRKKYPLASHDWINNFFQDPLFLQAYFNGLKKLSSPQYLEAFLNKNTSDFQALTRVARTDKRNYLFYDYKYIVNRDFIASFLLKTDINKRN